MGLFMDTPNGFSMEKDDEDNQTEEGDASPLFPKTGHPIEIMNKRKGETFNMEHHEWEHKNLIDNRTRGNAWVKAQIHSREFIAPQSEANGQSVKEQPFEQQPVEDQVQMNFVTPPTGEQPEEQAEGVTSKNKRGQMQMHNVHARKECKLILLNKLNQPVGPTEDVVTELSSFLGTLARNATLCPFDIFDWRSMDTKKDFWDYTKEKYIIPEAAKDWALVTIREAWRRHRRD
ncbi:hypothetical protein H5410_002868 [Solanum commersonii]|uniref:Uncharacterized protein n=1 Tax=Solanum commersonii TaxID=4109 RepID=A0A9J6B431_SOLCO|nr:hypothetical protein H5410_002868 [Solanum commersonii]